ncbi:MAG: hypothetical protein EOM91_19560 [Sphingobacteriia bacterium]|nr:hypothetical protein [Sphingobacteriia bacterium]
MEHDDGLERMLRLIEARCGHVRCPDCGSARLALIVKPPVEMTPAIEKARAKGRLVIPTLPIPTSRPVWQCIDCDAWVHYPGPPNPAL